jgi:catechol 2,3-dioxygenase
VHDQSIFFYLVASDYWWLDCRVNTNITRDSMNAITSTREVSADLEAIDPMVRIGHVHLKVSDLERSVSFYTTVLGFELTGRLDKDSAFLSAGGYHHHIALNTWHSRGGARPAPGTTGLYHFAILYPDRLRFAAAYRRLASYNIPITGASDHGLSEAVYLDDPDGNGLELTWDRPREQWPRTPDGALEFISRPLDLNKLAEETHA